jgi:hypothetical protein
MQVRPETEGSGTYFKSLPTTGSWNKRFKNKRAEFKNEREEL